MAECFTVTLEIAGDHDDFTGFPAFEEAVFRVIWWEAVDDEFLKDAWRTAEKLGRRLDVHWKRPLRIVDVTEMDNSECDAVEELREMIRDRCGGFEVWPWQFRSTWEEAKKEFDRLYRSN